MIISKTPYRVSFFGGGTDYPCWYQEHGGSVLSAAIDRYCYISCRYLPPFFSHKHRVVYSIVEEAGSVEDIRHPAVRECLKFMKFSAGLEIHHDGDLPKQAGLGTSSSFVVGLLNALYAMRGEMKPPMDLAREAIHVERDLCQENVGSQDQVCAAHGGLNQIDFAPGNVVSVRPVTVSAGRLDLLQKSLMLVFSGFSRRASDIAAEQVKNISSKEKELHEMQKMVAEGIRILTGNGSLSAFGKLLHEGWLLKRSLSSKVTTGEIDSIYARALSGGAIGGKLCGAGGGGFLLLFVEPDRRESVMRSLDGFLHVPFRFEWLGSRIIVYQPESSEKDGSGQAVDVTL